MLKHKTKLCKCGLKLGQKVRTCPKCQHKFEFKKIIKNPKKCPNCFIDNRPRAIKCICGHKFISKNKKSKFEEISKLDWKKLKKDDIFYIRKGGMGPYYLTEDNQKILFGYRGQFKVLQIKDNGIIAYSNKEACCFIYMGKQYKCENTGLIKRRHRLWKKN